MGWPKITENPQGTIILSELIKKDTLSCEDYYNKVKKIIPKLGYENFLWRKIRPLREDYNLIKKEIYNADGSGNHTRYSINSEGVIKHLFTLIKNNITTKTKWIFNIDQSKVLLKELNKDLSHLSKNKLIQFFIEARLETITDMGNDFTLNDVFHIIIEHIGFTEKPSNKDKEFNKFISICQQYSKIMTNPLITFDKETKSNE